MPHLCLKAFHQDGHQQVEEDVIPEGHQGYKVEGGQRRRGRHAVVQDHIPVLLSQDLQRFFGLRETLLSVSANSLANSHGFWMLTYTLTNKFTQQQSHGHPFTHPLAHLVTHSLARSLNHSLGKSFIHSFIHSLTHPPAS